MHIHDGRLAGHRDRFLDPAEFQIGVHGRHEVPRQLDAFAFHDTETGQLECYGIAAGPEIDDAVLAGVVGDDRPDSFNQDGAGGFHSYTRQDSTRVVLDNAGDRGLRIGR